ncbi:MAG: TonB C-terminal domain-containing protein [Burkholderiaceae bacterium]|nr:TonB C-terminal domain-containing protein [Burkholderiaceae bacterium]
MPTFKSLLLSLRSFSTLQIALGVSFVLHAVPLTVRFVDPDSFNRVFQDTPLEVILVNANAQERPVKAQAIAQSSMAGGGDADAGRATTFLPASELTALGDATIDTNRKMDTLQEQQTILLAQLKKQLALLPAPVLSNPSSSPEVKAQEEKRRQLSKLLGEIERRITQENERPKKRYISPATREEVYAVYYDQLRQKIEAKGTVNFPEAAGKKLYGQLTMILTVNHDGRILATEIVQGSGNLTLDRRAQAIANNAGPFGTFNAAMRRKADQIVLVSRFKFTRDEVLETKLTNR